MNVQRPLLSYAAIFGLAAVVLGTLAEHAFREQVAPEDFRYLMTAVRYLQVHSAVLVALSLAALMPSLDVETRRGLWRSFWVLLCGTVLFAGSIFTGVAMASDPVFYLTPVGGVIMMLGWLSLAWTGLRRTSGLGPVRP